MYFNGSILDPLTLDTRPGAMKYSISVEQRYCRYEFPLQVATVVEMNRDTEYEYTPGVEEQLFEGLVLEVYREKWMC